MRFRLLGNDVNIVHKPATQDDPSRRKPDISLAKRVLGWEPKVQVIDGLKKTIAYFREELKAPTTRDDNARNSGPYGKIALPGLSSPVKP